MPNYLEAICLQISLIGIINFILLLVINIDMFEIMKELHVSKSKFRKFSISKFVKFKFQCKISSFAVMWEKILSMHSMQNILSEDKL